MATRMQQRRGTASQWTEADPVLAAGEIGFETDTGFFKMGDGTNIWSDLSYFKDLGDLAGSFEDYVPLSQKGVANGVATLNADGSVPVAQLSTIIQGAPDALNTLNELATAIDGANGIVQQKIDTALGNQFAAGTGINLAYDAGTKILTVTAGSTLATDTELSTAISEHNSDTTNVHGIADTSVLATATTVATAKSEAIADAGTAADTKVSTAVAALTKSSVGLANVDNTADSAKPVSTAQATAIATAKSEAIADATSQVNAVIASAPAALNTLDELAAALGDDANFATTVTNSLSAKAPLADPTFTGLTTVSASGIAFTDGTQTKQGVPSLTTINQQAEAYTTVLADRDKLVEVSSATGVTVTIPTNSSVAYPVGTSIDILQTGAGQVTIAGAGGVTVNATPGLKLRTQWSSATLFKRAENTWVVFGDLTA